MVEGGVQAALLMFRLIVMGTFAMSIILALIAVINMLMIGLVSGTNGIVGDVVAIIQIWLPFNFGAVFAWLIALVMVYATFKFSIMIRNIVASMIGNNV